MHNEKSILTNALLERLLDLGGEFLSECLEYAIAVLAESL
jgi:hypothetical protein